MSQIRDGLPFEILVDVIAAHDGQSLDGSPESRVEGRISRSIDLARAAGLQRLRLFLDRRDLSWLCAARGIDRYSPAAKRLRVDGVLVGRATADLDSHLLGLAAPAAERAFPIIADPSLTPGFSPYVPSDDEKRALVEKFKRFVELEALKAASIGMPN